LESLIQEAIERDAAFAPFLSPCQEITEFYIETRYPIGVKSPLPSSMLMKSLAVTQELVRLIRTKVVTRP
jgi:hypothetical protein